MNLRHALAGAIALALAAAGAAAQTAAPESVAGNSGAYRPVQATSLEWTDPSDLHTHVARPADGFPVAIVSGGGGGGPVTAADGAIVTLGSEADTAYGGSGSATEIAIEKAIFAKANAMAASLAGTLTVSGTVAISGTVPVSAASLPLPAGAMQQTGGSVAVALTTTTGTDGGGSITTGGTAQNAFASNASRKGGWIQNPVNATEDLYVSFTGSAVTTAGTPDDCDLAPGGSCPFMQGNTVITSAISVNAVTTAHKFLAVSF